MQKTSYSPEWTERSTADLMVDDSPLDVRTVNGRQVVRGYAARFNSMSRPLVMKGKKFQERIAPGAFTSALSDPENDLFALVGHDKTKLLARRSAGTLTCREDSKGLYVEIVMPDTTDGRDALEQVRMGNIRGMSFGFKDWQDSWDTSGSLPVRTLTAVGIGEVSLTPFPAYPSTSASIASDAAEPPQRTAETEPSQNTTLNELILRQKRAEIGLKTIPVWQRPIDDDSNPNARLARRQKHAEAF